MSLTESAVASFEMFVALQSRERSLINYKDLIHNSTNSCHHLTSATDLVRGKLWASLIAVDTGTWGGHEVRYALQMAFTLLALLFHFIRSSKSVVKNAVSPGTRCAAADF